MRYFKRNLIFLCNYTFNYFHNKFYTCQRYEDQMVKCWTFNIRKVCAKGFLVRNKMHACCQFVI